MKKILVRENIDFKRGRDSKKSLNVGQHSSIVKQRKLDYIRKKLVKDVDFSGNPSDSTSSYHDEKNYVLDHIDQYILILERLHEVGVTKNRIKLYGTKLNIRSYRGLAGNTVSANFLIEEDIHLWVDFMKKYSGLNPFPSAVGGLSQMGGYYSLDEITKILDDRFEDEIS